MADPHDDAHVSDPELVESIPRKHESCPIPPCFPEPSESWVGPGDWMFFRLGVDVERSMWFQFRDYLTVSDCRSGIM